MKRLIKICGVAVAAMVLMTGAAWAYPVQAGDTVLMYNGNTTAQYEGYYQADNLGDSAGKFGVFCLELNEYFSLNTKYTVKNISSAAEKGGLGGAVSGSDPISDATRWLYYHFLLKDLSTYVTVGTGDNDYALQLAFWYLEDELNSRNDTNKAYYDAYNSTNQVGKDARAYVGTALAQVKLNASLGDVAVMNLVDAKGNLAQSQLIGQVPAVPEPSTLLLMGAGLAGLGYARRRYGKK